MRSLAPALRALAGDISDGTAGVALFLAELGAVTGHAAAPEHGCRRDPPRRFASAHGGRVPHQSRSDRVAAVRVAAVLDEDELAAAGRALLARCSPTHGTRRSADVILDAAGEILVRSLAGVLGELSLLPR